MTNILKTTEIEKIKLENFLKGVVEASKQYALDYFGLAIRNADIHYVIKIAQDTIIITFLWKTGYITHYVGSHEYPVEHEIALDRHSITLDKNNKKEWCEDITAVFRHIENSLIN